MKRFILPIIMSFIILGLSGCALSEAGKTALEEVTGAYHNMVEKADHFKTWILLKIDQTEKAAEDIQKAADEVEEATESVNDALESLKEVTGE